MKQVSKNNRDWADIVFTAEANQEEFEKLEIITLRSHYDHLVYREAWNRVSNPNDVEKQAKIIMAAGEIFVQEGVEVTEDLQVRVYIDRPKITDDVVVEVLDILTHTGIRPNLIYTFGETKTFTPDGFFLPVHKTLN